MRVQEAKAVLEGWDEERHLRLLSRRDGGSLLLAALDPQPATREVFRRLYAVLLMSGTLHPGEMYVNLLGLETRRTRIREYLSVFPPQASGKIRGRVPSPNASPKEGPLPV